MAVTELAALNAEFGSGVSEISRKLRNEFAAQLRPLVSPATAKWLDLMVEDASYGKRQRPPEFREFVLKGSEEADLLHARNLRGRVFLVTVDGRTRVEVTPTDEHPFGEVANDPRIAFGRRGDTWRMIVRDPRLESM